MRTLQMLVAVLLCSVAPLVGAKYDVFSGMPVPPPNIVNVNVNLANVPVGQEQRVIATVTKAAETWTNVPGSKLYLNIVGTTNHEGCNHWEICFSTRIEWDCIPNVRACQSDSSKFNPVTNRVEVVHNIYITASIDIDAGLYPVSLHEMGHLLWFNHSDCVTRAVMCASVQDLGTDDIAGMQFVYPETVVDMNTRGEIHIECAKHGSTYYTAELVLMQDVGSPVQFDVTSSAVRQAPARGDGDCALFNPVDGTTRINVREPGGLIYEYKAGLVTAGRMFLPIISVDGKRKVPVP